MKKQRAELIFGLLFNSLSLLLHRFPVWTDLFSGFLCGFFLSLGFFLSIVSMLPESIYNKLLYRKWFAEKNR